MRVYRSGETVNFPQPDFWTVSQNWQPRCRTSTPNWQK